MNSDYHECECGNLISGDYKLCLKCRSDQMKPDCGYYNEKEKSVIVPYCEYYDREILSFGYFKCRDCERGEIR